MFVKCEFLTRILSYCPLMAAAKFGAWKRNYDGFETHMNGWSEAGFSEGYGDQVFKRSIFACNPNEGYVITAETIVEPVRIPVVTIHQSSSPAKGGHLKLYEFEDNEGSSPINMGPTQVYGADDYRGNMSVSSPHETSPMSTTNWKQIPNSNGGSTDNWRNGSPAKGGHLKLYEVDDNGRNSPVTRGPMKVYRVANNGGNMSVSPPHKTGPMSIMNWKQTPNSDGYGGTTDNWKDGSGTGTNIYGGHNGTASNGIHPHFEGYDGRNKMVTDTKQKPNKNTETGFTGVDDWEKTRKSPTVMTAPIRSVTGKPTQGRLTVPPSVALEEIFPSTIDSKEAARRYGGYSVPPQVLKEAKTYTPTIDSNEAARRYGGHSVPTQALKETKTYTPTIDSNEAARRYGGCSVPTQALKEARTYTPTIDGKKAAKWYKGQIL